MRIRDEIALAVLIELINDFASRNDVQAWNEAQREGLAITAYEMADTMMKVRSEEKPTP